MKRALFPVIFAVAVIAVIRQMEVRFIFFPTVGEPAVTEDAATAQLLTPAVMREILKLQLPSNWVFLLKLRQDDLGETRLTIYA